MQIIPVLDLKGGQVVRGVAGRREEYRPIVSQLTSSAQPLAVARAFRDHFGLTLLYLADLDAIAGAPPALETYAALAAEGFRLWVDAGVRDAADVEPLAVGVERLVAGLETLHGPDALSELCRQVGSKRLIFSLDLKEGQPLANPQAWGTANPWAIAKKAILCDLRYLIVLDLAHVGLRGGTGTEDLCFRLAQTYTDVRVIAGGGISDVCDLKRLQNYGMWGLLVASALHDGRLSREDLSTVGCRGEPS